MRLFHIQPDDANWCGQYEISASHLWGLPGVRCSVCGRTWSTTGMAYPTFDLSTLPSVARYCELSPVTVEDFRELRDPLLRLLPADSVLPPGTEFGSLVGKAQGEFGDFAWVNPWTMLVRHEASVRLTSENVRLPEAVVPRLEFPSQPPVKLLEFQIEPLATLSPASFLSTERSSCSFCGYDARKVDRIIVSEASMLSDVDLFRLRGFPTVILATERFAKVVQEASMTGILMSEASIGE